MTKRELKYFFLITIIFLAACIETDIYLPAFPNMMGYFGVSEEAIQRLLTWNFIGICVSGPFYGPISDAIGRRRPLLFALLFFFLGSIMTIMAQGYSLMLIGRLLQGVGAGGCFTLGSAIIFDAFHKDRSVQALNKLNLAIPIFMSCAPIVGGWLNMHYGFRSNFTFIGVVTFLSLLVCWWVLDEPLPEEKRMPLKGKVLAKNFGRAMKSFPFWQMTIVISLLFAGYLLFLSQAAVLFVVSFGIDESLFQFFQASILIAWLAASLLFSRIMKRFGPLFMKMSGIYFVIGGGVAMILATYFAPRNPYLLTSSMLFYSFGVNWIMSLYFPEGMEALPDIKGITSSLLTSFRLLITVFIIGIVSRAYNGSVYPTAFTIVLIVAICMPMLLFYEAQKKRTKALEPVE